MPTLSRRERNKARNRQQIYSSALTLFAEQGYAATTIQSITDHADVGKSTFFNYFASKEAILATYYREVTEDMLTHVRAQPFVNVKTSVTLLLRRAAFHATHNKPLFVQIARLSRDPGVLASEDQALDEELLAFFQDLVAQGQSSGEVRDDLAAPMFGSLILGMMTTTAHEWILGNFDFEQVLLDKLAWLFAGFTPR